MILGKLVKSVFVSIMVRSVPAHTTSTIQPFDQRQIFIPFLILKCHVMFIEIRLVQLVLTSWIFVQLDFIKQLLDFARGWSYVKVWLYLLFTFSFFRAETTIRKDVWVYLIIIIQPRLFPL